MRLGIFLSRLAKFSAITILVPLLLFPSQALADDYPKPGDTLPPLTFTAPEFPGDRAALGIGDAPTFTLADLGAKAVLVEVIGVYCAQCYKQCPEINKLYKRLEKNGLLGKIQVFALAAGGTPPECLNLRKSGKYLFPVVTDPEYEIHKKLAEPKTPYTMILSPDGRVLYAHLGVLDDLGPLYAKLKELAE